MKLFDIFRTTLLIPKSIGHLLKVKNKLKYKSYLEILNDNHIMKTQNHSAQIIVKSYFWSCRLIPSCKCLPRSIALYQNLKAMGYDVEHKFGVLKSSLEDKISAHAWVEVDGKALNESKNIKNFTVLQS